MSKKPQTKTQKPSSYAESLAKFNKLASEYAQVLPSSSMIEAFARAGYGLANQPQIQNQRVKSIPTLPCDYTKDDIAEFLRMPYISEQPLRETAAVLKWTAYPFFKTMRVETDIPLYRYLSRPLYLTQEDAQSKEFLREYILIDKLNKRLAPNMCAHKIVGEAMESGKVFYVPRVSVDKVHNKVNYAFMQRLPQNYCKIIGFNNVSGYTVSFDMMYFLQPGTDFRQFGDLFVPYLEGFDRMFRGRKGQKFVYAARNELQFFPENIDPDGPGEPQVFQQNGSWAYWVSLPIDKVWTFEIDDTTAVVASPLSGLMLTYSQQSDYEQIQKELLTNPLIKIFTGSIPYFDDLGTMKEDAYRLSEGGRMLFEAYFNQLMAMTSTGGAAFYTAPVNDIKSHDYAESANANDISLSFNRYAMSKTGLEALIPVDGDVKASQVSASEDIEAKYTQVTLWQFERMMRSLYESFNLRYEWDFTFIGDIFHEKQQRETYEKAASRGDTDAYMFLAALDGESLLDKASSMRCVKALGILDMLEAPATSYTQSTEDTKPTKDIKDVIDGDAGESTEDQIDAYGANKE